MRDDQSIMIWILNGRAPQLMPRFVVPDGDRSSPEAEFRFPALLSTSTGSAGHPADGHQYDYRLAGWIANLCSDAATTTSLRTADGHMKMSEGNNLPIVNGSFVAGDVRASENPDLTALQVLFVREHNYQVDKLHAEHHHWSGDRLYETAKAITTAEMVNITYSEFLPHLFEKVNHALSWS